ncbi:MAG: c-type cytochrome [Ilumatobacteraceae bacterium]
MNPRTFLSTGILVSALTFGAAACGSDGEPTAAASSDDPVLTLGAEVYQQGCASCHGADLRGTDKGPSHLSIVYEPNHHSDDSFRSAIANGAPQHHWPFGDMPAVEGLSAEEVEAVIAFIRSEQQRLGFEQ